MPKAKKSVGVRFLSLNCALWPCSGGSKSATARALEILRLAREYDVIAFQEVFRLGFACGACGSWPDFFRERLPGYTVVAEHGSRDRVFDIGLVIATRLPVRDEWIVPLRLTRGIWAFPLCCVRRFASLCVDLETEDGKHFTVANNHLVFDEGTTWWADPTALRLEQLRDLSEALPRDRPWLCVGDFNLDGVASGEIAREILHAKGISCPDKPMFNYTPSWAIHAPHHRQWITDHVSACFICCCFECLPASSGVLICALRCRL